MALKESGEMYLETIYILNKKSNTVRSIDVGEYMGYSKPSVSRAMGLLKNGGYINIDRDGFITLTDAGMEIAKKLFERHTVLSNILITLGVDEKTATEDACRIEHVISEKSFNAMKKHLEKNI
ncbi:MAG: metal-dependent transcriptional regulator [Clostridia bacterium]|nr:metal-dependent transcriptional regulator [Clostridia bacterium]